VAAKLRARLRVAGAWMNAHYLRIDPRTAGLYRIVLGALLAADCLRHAFYTRLFYSNDGVLSNHWHLYKPDGSYNFSLFHAFSTPAEVYVAFGLALLAHLCLMIGWHARLAAFLSLLVVTSLDNRLVMVENGGYVVVNLDTSYKITDSITVFGVLNNAFNERYDTYGAFADFTGLPFPLVPGGAIGPTRTASPGTPIAGYGGVKVTF